MFAVGAAGSWVQCWVQCCSCGFYMSYSRDISVCINTVYDVPCDPPPIHNSCLLICFHAPLVCVSITVEGLVPVGVAQHFGVHRERQLLFVVPEGVDV